MPKKPSPETPQPGPSTPSPNAVKDSAQQIWLAGLGAFAKAQEEGSKMFEGLVRDGLGMQRKTQAAAEEKLTEATNRLTDIASGLAAKTGGQLDKLENLFEGRVAKAMQNLGLPTAAELHALNTRLDAMQKTLDALVRQGNTKPAAKKAPAKAASRKTLAKHPSVPKK
ncbi:phasin family protein [Variovorax sp. HJSM1_2]|uniref:phasin family protein n=1 Tax=Variovorax sp. HJSM1_2 TaxID=3366263 RepID=UPI003BE2C03C